MSRRHGSTYDSTYSTRRRRRHSAAPLSLLAWFIVGMIGVFGLSLGTVTAYSYLGSGAGVVTAALSGALFLASVGGVKLHS